MNIKKIIICFFLSAFLFCGLSISSKAESKEYTLNNPFYNLEFYDGDYWILDKGYYLIVGDDDMYPIEFSGNFESYYNYETISSDNFKSHINVEVGYENGIDEIMDEYYNDNVGFAELSIFLRVDDFAMLTYGEGFGTLLYCFGIEIPNDYKTKYHVVDFDDKTPLSDIIKKYSYSDNVDKTSDLKVLYTSNYFPGAYPDYYELYFEVSDSSGNVSTVKDYVFVHDFASPVITSTTDHYEFEVNTSNLTSDDIFNNLTIKDNITTYNNMTKNIVDTYQSKYDIVGDYSITYTMTDTSANTTTKTITIKVKDTTAPSISLKAGGDTIYTNRDLSTEEIYNLLDISDNYDDIDFSDVSINCTSDGLEGVEYQVTVSVTDSNNNSTSKTYAYYINDTTAPSITVRDTVYLEKGRKYTTEELLNILKTAGLINDDATNINIISEELISSSKDEDVYLLSFEQTLSDGSTQTGSVTLKYQKESTNNYLYIIIGASALLLLGVTIVIIKRKKKHANN